ncbi:hypothetical protein ACQY0O_004509 [Thecaphora frezii]
MPLVRQRPGQVGWSNNAHDQSTGQRLSSYLSANEQSISSTPVRPSSQLSAPSSRSKSPLNFLAAASGHGDDDGSSRSGNALGAAWSRFKSRNKASPSSSSSSSSARPTAIVVSHRSDGQEGASSSPSHSSPSAAIHPEPAWSPGTASHSSRPSSRDRPSHPPPSPSTGSSAQAFRGRTPSLRRRNSGSKGVPKAVREEGEAYPHSNATMRGTETSERSPSLFSEMHRSASGQMHRAGAATPGEVGNSSVESGPASVSSPSSLSRFFGTRKRPAAVAVVPSSRAFPPRSSDNVALSTPPNSATRPSSPPLAVISGKRRDTANSRSAVPDQELSNATPPLVSDDPPPYDVARSKDVEANSAAATPQQRQPHSSPSAKGDLDPVFAFPGPLATSIRGEGSSSGGQQTPSARSRHTPALSAPLTPTGEARRKESTVRAVATSVDEPTSAPPVGKHERSRSRPYHLQGSRSLSLNKLASFLSGPPTPEVPFDARAEAGNSVAGRSISRRAKASQPRPSTDDALQRTKEISTSSGFEAQMQAQGHGSVLAHKPSFRSRLRIPKFNSTTQIARPSTPEIESWKHKPPPEQSKPRHGRRKSVDAATQLGQDAPPVKIMRSRSLVRRKLPPQFDQEELSANISQTTPAGSSMSPAQMSADDSGPSLHRDLTKERRPSPPMPTEANAAGSLSGSSGPTPPHIHHIGVAREDLASVVGSSQSSDADPAKTPKPKGQRAATAIQQFPLGRDIDGAAPQQVDLAVPERSLLLDATSITEATLAESGPALLSAQVPTREVAPSEAGSFKSKSVGDASIESERPWSLISAGETDTPLLRLRKLVVDTNSPSDRSTDDELFFRPLPKFDNLSTADGSGPVGTIATPPMVQCADERNVDSIGPLGDQLESLSLRSVATSEDDGTHGGRISSPSTARSDLKHEVSSIHSSVHSSGSSTLKAGHFFAPSVRTTVAAAPAVASSQLRHHATHGRPESPSEGVHVPSSLRDRDMLRPLPHETTPGVLRATITHHQGGSTSTVGSPQEAKRGSVASRLTVSSSHLSEGVLSEDALSALEAEVGQARRAEVVAFGKGRVLDWFGEGSRPLVLKEGPTLSRSGSLKRNDSQKGKAGESAAASQHNDKTELSELVQMSHQLDERLQRLAIESGQSSRSETSEPIRDIPDEASSEGAHRRNLDQAPVVKDAVPLVAETSPFDFNTIARQPNAAKYARLSAFHDRKLPSTAADTEQPALTTVQLQDEAVRLGRAPSKRMRRMTGEAKSAGEAVMVIREPAAAHAKALHGVPASRLHPTQLSSGPVAAFSPSSLNLSTNEPIGSALASSVPSSRSSRILVPGDAPGRTGLEGSEGIKTGFIGLTHVPTSAAAAAAMVNGASERHSKESQRSGRSSENERSRDPQQEESDGQQRFRFRPLPEHLTTEEAILAKQKERYEREQRQRRREEKKQLEQQRRYALKKKSDPLLATRLALAGIQSVSELVPENSLQLDKGARSRSLAHLEANAAVRSHEPERLSIFVTSPSRQTFAVESSAMLEFHAAGVALRPSLVAASGSHTPDFLRNPSTPPSRHTSFVGSIMSFHTADSGSSEDNFTDPAADSATHVRDSTLASSEADCIGPIHGTAGKDRERTDIELMDASDTVSPQRATAPSLKTMQSIASSLTVDFEFPVPPQRLREQLSDDGTLLSRAGLREAGWESSYDTGFPGDYRQLHQSPSMLGLWSEPSGGSVPLHPASESPRALREELSGLRRAKSVEYREARMAALTLAVDECSGSTDERG